jgi:hypothetical protein
LRCIPYQHIRIRSGNLDTNGTLVVARMPLFILEASIRTNTIHFEWQGGTAPYQLQQSTNLNTASWEDAGELTTETTAVTR